jgi:hypothetical protein
MGALMLEDDIQIPSLLELLNLRFAPNPEPGFVGGVDEMAALQKAFKIFQDGRSFTDSVRILNIGGLSSPRARTRWFQLLDYVGGVDSSVAGQKGGPAMVAAMIANLESDAPKPVYFTAHDARHDARVIVGHIARPIFYIDQDYLTISFPMAPRRARRSTGTRRRRTTPSAPAASS